MPNAGAHRTLPVVLSLVPWPSALILVSMPEIFTIVPAPGRALGVLTGTGIFLLLLIVLFGYIAYSGRNARFEVSDEGLRIRGTLYGRTIPLHALVVDEARVVDLTEEPALRPMVRTNGVGLSGYNAGWFRMQNGDRALLFVTERDRTVHLPTREGYDVLLSAERPDAFVDALRRASSGPPGTEPRSGPERTPNPVSP